MAGSRDVVQLKLQRRLIEEQLKKTDEKMNRLDNIILKKSTSRPFLTTEDPALRRATTLGLTVAEFKLPPRNVRSIPKDNSYDPYATDACPINNHISICNRREKSIIDDFVNGGIKKCSAAQAAKKID